MDTQNNSPHLRISGLDLIRPYSVYPRGSFVCSTVHYVVMINEHFITLFVCRCGPKSDRFFCCVIGRLDLVEGRYVNYGDSGLIEMRITVVVVAMIRSVTRRLRMAM